MRSRATVGRSVAELAIPLDVVPPEATSPAFAGGIPGRDR